MAAGATPAEISSSPLPHLSSLLLSISTSFGLNPGAFALSYICSPFLFLCFIVRQDLAKLLTAQPGLELAILLLDLQSAGITHMHHHAWLECTSMFQARKPRCGPKVMRNLLVGFWPRAALATVIRMNYRSWNKSCLFHDQQILFDFLEKYASTALPTWITLLFQNQPKMSPTLILTIPW